MRGITIKVSGNPNTCWGLHSRYCREQFLIPQGMEPRDYWAKLLLSPGDESLRGHVVFACNDEAVEFLAKNRDRMLERYLIPDFTPELQLALLDKQKTLELARSVGVPVPQFWNIKTIEDVKRIRSEVMFPVMVKPIHSHRFQRVFNKKLFVIKNSFEELVARAGEALRNDLEIMVVEMIPGPDSLLCSQFSYFDANGNELYNYTKRVIRRYPVNAGPACYHITEWIPEVNELARKFLKGINFRGLANPEFKRDTRDGKLKVIEVNIRFTAVHELLVHSGLPLDLMVYCHLTEAAAARVQGLRAVHAHVGAGEGLQGVSAARSRGELTFAGWLRSIMQPEDLSGLPLERSLAVARVHRNHHPRADPQALPEDEMSQVRVPADKLEAYARAIMRAHGVDEAQAAIVAKNKIWCDLVGRTGYGVLRLPIIMKRVRHGVIEVPLQSGLPRDSAGARAPRWRRRNRALRGRACDDPRGGTGTRSRHRRRGCQQQQLLRHQRLFPEVGGRCGHDSADFYELVPEGCRPWRHQGRPWDGPAWLRCAASKRRAYPRGYGHIDDGRLEDSRIPQHG